MPACRGAANPASSRLSIGGLRWFQQLRQKNMAIFVAAQYATILERPSYWLVFLHWNNSRLKNNTCIKEF
jgi:hypothetical protein